MKRFETIYLFGIGGVGSWIADLIVRQNLCEDLVLIDFDKVEEKNIKRQVFGHPDIGRYKSEVAKENLYTLINEEGQEKEDDNMIITSYLKEISSEKDVMGLDKTALAILATDNLKSKQIIGKYFDQFLLINCDKDFVEIKSHLDSTELNAWDNGGGYNSEQNISSNVFAAISTVQMLLDNQIDLRSKFNIKIQNETKIRNLVTLSRRKQGEQVCL